MEASGKKGLRNVIIASALGGLLVSGACIVMTGATVDKMKEQAVTAVANMPAEAQPADNASNASSTSSASADGKDASAEASKPAASDSSSSASSSSAVSSEASSSASSGAAADADGSEDGAKPSEGASDASEDGKGAGAPAGGDIEVVGSGTRNGEKVYIIKWGDTLSYISAETGFSVDEIANLNEIRDVNMIYADSALRIPDEG